MDKKIAGLVGAISAGASLDIAHAAQAATPNVTEILRAQSYEELLKPIPNAVALLRAADAARPGGVRGEADSGPAPNVQQAQYYPYYYPYGYPYYHHHHHHHSYYPYYPYRHHHHHHHHHHHQYYDGE
jgi:hypothetical protein